MTGVTSEKEHALTRNAPTDSSIVGRLRSADGAGIVRLDGRFDVTADELWSALTDPGRLSEWLGAVEGDLRPGGEFRAHFFATGWEGTVRVEACERPGRLLLLTRSPGEPDCRIEVTLTADSDRTQVAIEDRGLPLQHIAAYGAGDQVLLEGLAAYLAGRDRGDAQARWRDLHPTYQDLAAGLS